MPLNRMSSRSMPSSGNSTASAWISPLPVAVPRWSWKRSSASSMSCRLLVGGSTTVAVVAKDTMPRRTLAGSPMMRSRAACCAALMRVGATSVASMLREMSMDRTSVTVSDGRVMVALGRAHASSARASATKNSRGGIWRRSRWREPSAARGSARLA
ncbi:hypothetical protein D3C81_1155090 [compost metagenome]